MCDVDSRNTRIVERTHGHLCTRFPNGLGSNDSCCFEWINTCFIQSIECIVDNSCSLLLRQFLESTLVDCKRHVMNDLTAEAVCTHVIDCCMKSLEDFVICKFIIKGAKFLFDVIDSEINGGLCTGTCSSSSCSHLTNLSNWTCCFRTSCTVLLHGSVNSSTDCS